MPATAERLSGDGREAEIGVPALVFWMVGQGAILLAGAGDVLPTAGGTPSLRQVMPEALMAGQIALGVLLFPGLVRSWRAVLLAGACGFPMVQMAVRMGSGGIAASVGITVAMAALLGALWLAQRISRGFWMMGAVLSGYTFGTLGLWYFLKDFQPQSGAGAIVGWICPLAWPFLLMR